MHLPLTFRSPWLGKFPSSNEVSRETGIAHGAYLREVRFYQKLSGTVGVQTPHIFFAEMDSDQSGFCIIMEDLAPAVQGDQLAGCDIEESELAMVQAARIHAPYWNDAALRTLDWLVQPTGPGELEEEAVLLAQRFFGFEERYRMMLTAKHMAVVRRFVQGYTRWVEGYSGPMALIHCDYRPDNIMFGGRYPATVVDWQTCSVGAPVCDVSYFLGAGVLPEKTR